MEAVTDTRDATRTRIVEAAATLLREEGAGAVTTRGVAQRAGVQAPTIYRLFGDKDGLLDAVAEQVMAEYVSEKADVVAAATAAGTDPEDDLRSGWQRQVDFGLAHPEVFRLLSDPARVRHSPAGRSGKAVLQSRVHRLAVAGRLKVSEALAVDLIQAAGTGTIQTLLATPPEQRQTDLAESMFNAVRAQILLDDVVGGPRGSSSGNAPGDQISAAAVTLRAAVADLEALSDAERALIGEWLDRITG